MTSSESITKQDNYKSGMTKTLGTACVKTMVSYLLFIRLKSWTNFFRFPMSGRILDLPHNKEKHRFTIVFSGNVRVKFLANSLTIPFWRAMMYFRLLNSDG